ncbi:hypothetical protein [Chelativorans sp. M5D2P16]|uniref:hypothetical protein n=1 Tax=Chelativorans sp. M5D2P16 TaxID=3095678 RepID=UPI002ACB03D4|nr:hypothetical protein [Chelativorans sp. M5D2P16]MDZ5695667.1 hypothetical protein [Chelativorans sp. M5D2P16]
MPERRNELDDPCRYFERPAEKLVLEGYRCWTHGYATRSTEPWIDAQRLYRRLLGEENGADAIIALAGFVKTLGVCAVCPLRMFRSGAPFICRDEALVLGLISGIQNADQPTVDYCLQSLCCPQFCEDVAMTAGAFALSLKASDRIMMPIPVHVLARIGERSHESDRDPAISRTIH